MNSCYKKYKESGDLFIGKIPDHWKTVKLKYLLENKKNSIKVGPFGSDLKGSDYIEEGIKVYNQRNVLDNDFSCGMNFISMEKSKQLSSFKTVSGDILVTTRGSIGKAAIIPQNAETGILHPCLIKLVVDRSKIDPELLLIILNNASFIQNQFKLQSNSTIIDVIYSETLKNVVLPISTIKEQVMIRNFLNNKVSTIDDAIEQKQKQIQTLQQYRQSLISETVTRGLNPHTEKKDSGVEWIGNIPEHWEMKRFKHVGAAIIGLTYSPNEVVDDNEGTLVLRSTNIKNGKIIFGNNVYVNKKIPPKLKTKKGDILICSRNGSRALIGKCGLIDENSEGLSFGAFTTLFRSNYNDFLFYVLNSSIFKAQAGSFLTSTINQLTVNNLYSFLFAFPPVKEQEEIVQFLNNKTMEVDTLIEEIHYQINTLEKYRQSLIYEAVTGKIGVRNFKESDLEVKI
jgi:type I restriction enzyme, S subunit